MVVAEHEFRGPFTWDDLAALPDDDIRREIIGGTLIVNPSPIVGHQRASLRLAVLLVEAAAGMAEVLTAPVDWRYDESGVVVPDLVVVEGDIGVHGPLPASVVPLLVVEVLSPSNAGYDRLLKRELYERLGVANFWLVDPGTPDREPSITALRLDDAGLYQSDAEATGDESFATDHPFSISFAPAELLRRPLRG